MKLSSMLKKDEISQEEITKEEENVETPLSQTIETTESTVSSFEGEYTDNELRDIAGVNDTNVVGNEIVTNDTLLPEQPNEAEQAELDNLKSLAGI